MSTLKYGTISSTEITIRNVKYSLFYCVDLDHYVARLALVDIYLTPLGVIRTVLVISL